MSCTTCHNKGILWVKIEGNDAIGKCACPEGQRDSRNYPTLTPERVKWFAAKEDAYQKDMAKESLDLALPY